MRCDASRTVNKRIKPCYNDMLTLMSCFKARAAIRAAGRPWQGH
jgi:hypothetical protein